jgi:hypothetical protein
MAITRQSLITKMEDIRGQKVINRRNLLVQFLGQNGNCQTGANICSLAPDGTRHQQTLSDCPSFTSDFDFEFATHCFLAQLRHFVPN